MRPPVAINTHFNLVIVLILVLLFNIVPLYGYKSKLIYKDNFNDPDKLSNWILEGPGEYWTKEKKLHFRSVYQSELFEKWVELSNDGEEKVSSGRLYAAMKAIAKVKTPELVDSFTKKGKFQGGHVVLWNKIEFPKNIKIEFEMKSVDPIGLFITFFAAKGSNGESIFSDTLKSRNGIFSQYHSGDINNYHLSYGTLWNGGARGETRLSKNPGHKIKTTGKDIPGKDTGVWHKIKIIKFKRAIKFFVDGQKVFQFKEKKGKYFKDGCIGLRQMATSYGQYRNFNVFQM